MPRNTELDAKTAWEKYHTLRAQADEALQKLADFACWDLGYGHLADGFTDDMYENYSILEDVLEKEVGPDPSEDYDEECDDEED